MYRIYKITSNHTVDFAAEELKKYLRMMMPRAGEISIEYKPEAKDGFRLGLMQDFALDVSEAEDTELDDIVHIDTDSEGGIIAGSNPRSVLLAVYRYLQENGCRWLFPGVDGEFIPMQSIKPIKYHKMADCRHRGQCNEGAEFQPNMMEAIDFTPKIGLNVFMLEFTNPNYYEAYYTHAYNPNREPEPITEDQRFQWKTQCEAEINKRGLQYHAMGHGWTIEPFGIKPELGAPVPEESVQYLAMTDGERGILKRNPHPYNTNVCMSNPKARKIMNDYIADYAENHTNVDYLHVWLADCWNNHCECEECGKKSPSDWYVVLMNELDELLTSKNIPMHIVFCCYTDTSWPPDVEVIKNPDRFSLYIAPISRDYTVPASEDVSSVTYPPYERNKIELFPDIDQYVKVGKEWQERCKLRAYICEYYFGSAQYKDPGTLSFARVIYQDIVNFKKHGFNGIVNDCTQRCFYPNGFPFFLYGQVQFDTSLSFEEVLEDYFSHAYGDDWREVLKIFEQIGEAMPYRFVARYDSADLRISKSYNPSVVPLLRKVPDIAEGAREFLEAHKNMPKRAQTVAYKLLRYYMEYCTRLSECLILKALGADAESKEALEKFLSDFGKYEIEIERYFDQFIMGLIYSVQICRIEKNAPVFDNEAAAR